MAFLRRRRAWSIALVVVACTVVVGAGWLALGTTRSGRAETERRASNGAPCVRALLADWADGRIDHTYPVRCYREAIKSLPTDLEVYSSAPEDIQSALRNRILQRSANAIRRQSP